MSDKVVSEIPAESKVEEAKSPGEVQAEVNPNQSRRMEIEAKVRQENEAPHTETEEVAKVEEKVEEVKSPDVSPTKVAKDNVQKRIDKEVAKRKTAEEELAEVRAENEKLKSQIKPEPKTEADVNREPTDLEIRTALLKAKKDGDIEFEVQILEYMAERKAKKERAEAEKSINEESTKRAEQAEQFKKDWHNIELDYQSENPELNLSNQKSLLFRVAKELYEDKELSKSVYSDPNRAHAMRRAVSDAYREIMENNLLPGRSEEVAKPSKVESRKRAQLADPSSTVAEEVTPASKDLSDTEKVLNDVKRRRQFQEERTRS